MFLIDRDYVGKRYSLARFTRYVSDMYDALDSTWIREVRLLPAFGLFPITTQEYRPDLLALDIYRDVDMWTIPLIYNGLMNEEDLLTGLEVAYPSLSDLESLYFRLVGQAGAQVI